jgi:hypothetical protein
MMCGVFCVCLTHVALACQLSSAVAGHDQGEADARTLSALAFTVIDEAGKAHKVTRDKFARLPRTTATASDHGADAKFTGASLVDVLSSCGIQFGDGLRGVRAPTVAILEATDDYRVVLSLLEIDPDTTDKLALIADERDGEPLSSQEGTHRLVLPGEKRQIRWIRNLETIRIVNLKDFPFDGLNLNSTRSSSPNDTDG